MRIKILFLASGLAWAALAGTEAPAQDKAGYVLAEDRPDTHPQPITRPDPIYPYEMAYAGVNGEVQLRFIIDIKGNTREVRLAHTNNPWFVRPAIEAVRKWKFTPARKNGTPVECSIEQVIQFSMNDGGSNAWRVQKRKDHADLPLEMQWETPPDPRWTTFPVYPFEALLAKQKGQTHLSFLVGPDGRVVEAKILEATTPEMGQAALAMIDTWRFTPARNKKGEPCFASLSMKHEFSPNGRSDVPVADSARNILSKRESHPEKILPMKELDAMPKLLWHERPVYPSKLLKDGRSGEAVIEFFIDEEGDAQLPRIVSATEPEFGYAAEQAIITWHFENPLKNGKPVITKAQIPVKFQHP